MSTRVHPTRFVYRLPLSVYKCRLGRRSPSGWVGFTSGLGAVLVYNEGVVCVGLVACVHERLYTKRG